jgi:anti-anti-sigma factor
MVETPSLLRAPSLWMASFPAYDPREGQSLVGTSRKPGRLVTSSAGKLDLEIKTAVKGSVVWICIRGDADISTLGQLDAALDSIVLDDHKAVCMDLSDLSFIDVTSLRRLTTFAMHLRQNGRDVMTEGAPPILRKVIEILPGQDQLGLA